MDYSKLSDFEINQKVGDMALKGQWACKPGSAGNETNNWQYGSGDPSLSLSSLPDYCNNPADAWSIIFSHRIGVAPAAVGDKWAAHYCNWDIAIVDTNPLRAAMIVFLMMQDK